ncbi:MAG: allophanate hydrolase, partial [Methyloligellaceae bacterium]
NNIVGLKPTLGALSATGVVPACKTLDTISIFALNVDDAFAVYRATSEYDDSDGFSRRIPVSNLAPLPETFTVGVPSVETREFYGDAEQEKSFDHTLDMIRELGGTVVELDFSIFYQVAQMLYDGAWVAERFTVIEHLLKCKPDALHEITREIIEKAEGLTAADAFRNIYYLKELETRVEPVLASVDMLCVPTAPTYYTVEQVISDPFDTNARLGTYTNFVNLLDMCGIAVPVAKREDGLPGSVTLLAASGEDAKLASLARVLQKESNTSPGATRWRLPELTQTAGKPTTDEIELAVVGAHMSGLPLNGELTRLNARFLRKAKTAACYRFYALAGGPPYRPGLVRDDEGGSIEIETWAVPKSRFGEFMVGVPSPLGIGTLTLDTGEQVKGFICEGKGIEGATEITEFGGWRNYMASLAK